MTWCPARNDREPMGKIKTNERWTDKIWMKVAAQPRRLWAVGGLLTFVIVVACFMLMPAQRKAPPMSSSSGATGTAGIPNHQSPASAAASDTKTAEKQPDFIRAVRLLPSQPTRMDRLKAEVEVTSEAPEQPVYTYLWKVNDRIIEGAKRDTLDLSTFKKGDLITCTITHDDGSTGGFAVESPVVVIHSVPPSLELKDKRNTRLTREPLELQLVGVAPDGNQIAFSLESPYVPGMTIDERSGKKNKLVESGRNAANQYFNWFDNPASQPVNK